MGPDKNYTPGSRGLAVKGASLYHYKVEMGPANFANLDEVGRDKKLNSLNDVETIGKLFKIWLQLQLTSDGNGQLFLVMQDIAMSNFTAELDKVSFSDFLNMSTSVFRLLE